MWKGRQSDWTACLKHWQFSVGFAVMNWNGIDWNCGEQSRMTRAIALTFESKLPNASDEQQCHLNSGIERKIRKMVAPLFIARIITFEYRWSVCVNVVWTGYTIEWKYFSFFLPIRLLYVDNRYNLFTEDLSYFSVFWCRAQRAPYVVNQSGHGWTNLKVLSVFNPSRSHISWYALNR